MISAKLFFAAIYLHLAVSIAAPVGILFTADKGWQGLAGPMILAHLGAAVLVQAVGWVCVFCSWQAYYQGRGAALRKAWKLLKLGTIPFYALNLLWSGFCWLMLVGASRGIMILFVPIPIIFTCLLVVQSGCLAHRYLRWLIERPGGQTGITGLLTFLQFVPVLDILSTVLLLKLTAAEEQAAE